MNVSQTEPPAGDVVSPLMSGFSMPNENWSKLPHEFINLLPDLTEAELRVTLYILRHTWGYGEYGQVKRITLDEFEFGRKDKDGNRMDRGCGVQRKAIERGLDRAVEHGLITVDIDASDKARVKKYYGIRMQPVIQMSPKDRSHDPKDSSDDLKDQSGGSLRLIDQRKNLLKETDQKEKEIDRAHDSFSSKTEPLETEPHPNQPAVQATARALMAEVIASGYDPATQTYSTPVEKDSTPHTFGIAREFGMTGTENDYWLAFLKAGEGFQNINRVIPYGGIAKLCAELISNDAKMDEVEIAIRERLSTRRSGKPYEFHYVFKDWRLWKDRQMPPLERDAQLVTAVQAGWGYTGGSDASNRMVDFLTGMVAGPMRYEDWGRHQLTDPMYAPEVTRFVAWYKTRMKDRSTPPVTAKTLRERIDDFRAQQRPAPTAPAADTYRPAERYTPTPEELAERRRLSEEARKRAERTATL
jgi:hypothetical protein